MKVKDLIKRLQELEPDLDVVLSSDDEGNSHRELRNCKLETGLWKPKDGHFTPFEEEKDGAVDNAVCLG